MSESEGKRSPETKFFLYFLASLRARKYEIKFSAKVDDDPEWVIVWVNLIFLSCLNEIPARPELCNFPLSKVISSAWAPWQWKTVSFFCVLCGREGLPSS